MRFVTVILIIYSAPLVFYGSLELTHDVMHYLDAHFNAQFHHHAHHPHHSMRDHSHSIKDTQDILSEDYDSGSSIPSLIAFFLYAERIWSLNFPETPPGEFGSSHCFAVRAHAPETPVPPPWNSSIRIN